MCSRRAHCHGAGTPVDKDQARALVATVLRLLPRVAATGRMRVGVSGAGGAAAAAADEEEDEADVVISAGTDGQLLDLHQYVSVRALPAPRKRHAKSAGLSSSSRWPSHRHHHAGAGDRVPHRQLHHARAQA